MESFQLLLYLGLLFFYVESVFQNIDKGVREIVRLLELLYLWDKELEVRGSLLRQKLRLDFFHRIQR